MACGTDPFPSPWTSACGTDPFPSPLWRASGPAQLLGLDYTAPVQQAFPTTAGGVIPGRTASEVFDFQEASGNLTGEVAATVLTAAGTPVYQQVIAGLYDGADSYSVKGIAFDFSTEKFEAGDNGTWDYNDTESLGFSLIARMPAKDTLGIIFAKRQSGSQGYLLYASNADLIFGVYTDGTSATCTITAPNDGAVHEIRCEINRTTGKATLTIADTGVTSGEQTLTGTATIAEPFVFGAGYTSGAVGLTYRQLAVFTGADAEGLAAADTTLTHATDPGTGGIFPQLTTYTRETLACPVVGDDPVYGLRVGKYGSGQFAHGWNTNFSHASKLGILVEAAATNLCKGSEEAATGADYADIGTPSKTSNAKEAPDGTQTMNRIAATGAQEGRKQTITVLAERKYSASLFVKRGIDGTNCFAEVEIYDASNAATIDTVQIDLNTNNKCIRPDIKITTPAGCTSIEYRLLVDDGSDIGEWGWQFELNAGGNDNEGASSYIPTTTASAATRNLLTTTLTDPGGNTYHNPVRGEIESVSVASVDNDLADGYIWEWKGSGSNDFFILKYNGFAGNDRPVFNHYDTGGVLKVNKTLVPATSHHLGHTVRYRWDSVNELAEHAGENWDVHVNGVREAGAAVTWTAGNNATVLTPGEGAAQYHHGLIATIKCWNGPRPDSV